MAKKASKRPDLSQASREHVSDDDDSSIASDDAFDSEDERRYGSFFEGRDKKAKSGGYDDDESESHHSDGDEDDEESESNDGESESNDGEDEDDGDGGDYMLSLLDKLDDKQQGSKSSSSDTGIAVHTKESEFAASVVKEAELTLDALMGSIQDTAGFGHVQKQLKKVAQGEATSVPLARVISDRIQRKHDYEEQCKDVSQWTDVVQQNRQAETLDFRPKERLVVTQQGLVDGFTPTTEFEKQIHAALQKAGQEDEEAILKRERERLQDDLDANEITLEEYKKRRGELAKMRALMFYHEQKRHHINKIKSKKYRRIRKRQRERLKDDEETEDADALREKEEVERIRERASLAHKNTSKWAKRVLKRGNKVDINTRKALSESLRRGDDLLKRMKSTRGGDESSDSESEDLVASAKAVLADMDNDQESALGNRKGLFQMSFMQKGIEKQKSRAREEARQLLKELEDDELPDEMRGDEPKREAAAAKKVSISSKKEMKDVLRESELVVTSLKLGQKHQVAVSGHIDIDIGVKGTSEAMNTSKEAIATSHSEHSVTVDQSEATINPMSSRKTDVSNRAATATKHKRLDVEDQSNPWVVDQDSDSTEKKATMNKRSSYRGVVDVEGAVDILEAKPVKNAASSAMPESSNEANHTSKAISSLPQGELVRRAFASVASLEEEDFLKEKALVAEEEDPTRKQLKSEAKLAATKGWGSWTGMGAPAPKALSKLPKKLQPPESKLGKRVRADEKKPNVILSEKRVKKLANNYMLSAVPYPFTSREEYEKAMSGTLGREFNVTGSFKDMTRPGVITRPGKVIQPISKTTKVRRSAAKF